MNNRSSRKRRSGGEEDSRSGKRNRKHRGDVEKTNQKESPRSLASSVTKRTKPSSLLQGKLVAVSTLVEASSEESPEGYSQIVSLCKDLGAQTTGQVHRRVDAVIATQSAVEGNTQRVRKAWKKGIPVVSPAWIRTCMKEGRSVGMGPFLQTQPVENHRSQPRKQAKAVPCSGDSVPVEKDESWVVDLGCCCVCHEAASDPTDCSWCVDCSLNRPAHTKQEPEKPHEKEEAVTIDLGCCCVCHDEANGRTECPWCQDCSVNKQFVD